MDKEKLEEVCRNMRLNMLTLTYQRGNKGAHIASSLSMTEIVAVLFKEVMDLSTDIFVLSKGHAGMAYYAGLFEAGLISQEDLDSFDTDGGDFPGQPSKNLQCGIIFSSGSLGMGLPYCVGRALGLKKQGIGAKVYCALGDGECNEGSVWESALLAKQHNLDNLIAIVDWNRMQSDGDVANILDINMPALWEACGWTVVIADGHDVCALKEALDSESNGKPLVVLARTIKGKGVSFIENQAAWHHKNLTKNQYEQAIEEVQNGI